MEYALYADDFIEMDLMVQNLQQAKSAAIFWIKSEKLKNATIKVYDDIDLRHQYDYKNGKWVQYE